MSKLSDAAIMADEFVLTHRGSFSSVSFKNDMSKSKFVSQVKTKSAVLEQSARAAVISSPFFFFFFFLACQ